MLRRGGRSRPRASGGTFLLWPSVAVRAPCALRARSLRAPCARDGDERELLPCQPVDEPIESRAARNVGDILGHAIEHGPDRAAIVVADSRCGLARLLAAAYRTALPGATHLDFDATAPEEILSAFANRQAG